MMWRALCWAPVLYRVPYHSRGSYVYIVSITTFPEEIINSISFHKKPFESRASWLEGLFIPLSHPAATRQRQLVGCSCINTTNASTRGHLPISCPSGCLPETISSHPTPAEYLKCSTARVSYESADGSFMSPTPELKLTGSDAETRRCSTSKGPRAFDVPVALLVSLKEGASLCGSKGSPPAGTSSMGFSGFCYSLHYSVKFGCELWWISRLLGKKREK